MTTPTRQPWWPECWGDAPPRCPVGIDRKTRERKAWPIAPVIEYLVARLGMFDKHENETGYCSAKVEQLTTRFNDDGEVVARGIHRTSWQRYAQRGYLTAAQADLVACRLGKNMTFFWPEYSTAIEPDNAFLAEWDHGNDGQRAAARIRLAERGRLVVV